jgi:replication factor A1
VKLTKEIRRYDGTWIRQADCVVGDEQGVVDFLASNEQLDVVKEGAVITIRNGHAKVLRETGRIKLIVDKWGKVEKSSEKISNVNLGNNLSAVEYELVAAGKK